MPFRPLSTRKMCCNIPSESCGCSVRQPGSSLESRCYLGRRVFVTPTAYGPGIGTAKWQKRRRFNRIAQDSVNCLKVSGNFTRVAALATTGFMNAGCIKDLSQTRMAQHDEDELFFVSVADVV